MTPQEERNTIKRLLAGNRYAECPDNVSKKRFAAIRHNMERRYMQEWMATPPGLYSDSDIWHQTFLSYLKQQQS